MGYRPFMAFPWASNVTLLSLQRRAANLHGGSALVLSHLSDYGFVLSIPAPQCYHTGVVFWQLADLSMDATLSALPQLKVAVG